MFRIPYRIIDIDDVLLVFAGPVAGYGLFVSLARACRRIAWPGAARIPGWARVFARLAAEVRGEGIFVELDEEALHRWETSDVGVKRAKQLEHAFKRSGSGDFPGIRFDLLHSLSHLLLTAVSLEGGYHDCIRASF